MKKEKSEAYPKKGRVILHIDMNAFYCSVHQTVEPQKYAGKCIAVAGSVELRKGIVVTSSYESRRRGVRTGMQVREALKVCPELTIIQPNFELYHQFSQRFLDISRSVSPMVEAMSIDECFIDITGSKQFGTPLEIAGMLQRRIRDELGLPCSIGVAPNKLLAKMASDMKKPNGLTVLRLRDVRKLLWHRPCDELFGIGERTAEKLRKLGIHTIGQLAAADEDRLSERFGVLGAWLKQAANGIDTTPVTDKISPSKSIGHTTTLPRDYSDMEKIQRVFLNLTDQVTRRLRHQRMLASTIQITIRDPHMKTITRSLTLPAPTEDAARVHEEACRLFMRHWDIGKPVRLLGVTLSQLSPKKETAVQLDLFTIETAEKREQLTRTMDEIRDKFGESSLLTAGMVGDDPSSLIRNKKVRGTSLDKDYLRKQDED